MKTSTSARPAPSGHTPHYPVSLGASYNLVERITAVLAKAASPERLADREWRPVLLALKDARDVLAAKQSATGKDA